MSYRRTIPVEFNHCDPAGIVFYARYFEMTNSVCENFFAEVVRRSYAEAPVSPLVLFRRTQEFAYQQEVDGNPSQRHHVRFWPTPDEWLLPGGRRVDWLASGTFDSGVGLSFFTLQVTHRIARDIDTERDHVLRTVTDADPAVSV